MSDISARLMDKHKSNPSSEATWFMNSDNFVRIAVLENEIEARLVESILDDRNLPHLIRSYHDTAYDGLYQFQMGWGELRAPEELKHKIKRLLESIRQPDNEPTATDGCS